MEHEENLSPKGIFSLNFCASDHLIFQKCVNFGFHLLLWTEFFFFFFYRIDEFTDTNTNS